MISIDESIVPYKEKTSSIRQYIPKKPNRWSFKLWMLCDQIYLVIAVVFQLMENYLNKKHVVITDNFYTSMELAESLLQKGTYLVGQIKSNAKGLDKNWIAIQKEELKIGKGIYFFK